MIEKNEDKYVVVKTTLPTSLKLQFKVVCTQKRLTMSQVLEELIGNWIRANAPISDFILDLPEEDSDNVKGYFPESLKTQFKVFCTQKKVTMRSVLYNLINKWLKAESD